MPPKRRGAQSRTAQATRPPPEQPPPQPIESDAEKVRKEWSKFIDTWYEPQKKKLIDKVQKDLIVKYKNLGSAKETQKLREMELFEKLDSIAQQLTQPARAEWERRLDIAQLREDQWDDMAGEEQQAVMSVFVGFFADDVEDLDDVNVSPNTSSTEEDCLIEDPQHRPIPPHPPSTSARQPVPPTPIRGNFEFVNPTSFFADITTPPNPSKNLPALSMDHLATLGPSNPARSAEPVSAAPSGTLGFQNWASEVGIVTQHPQGHPAKPTAPSASTAVHTLNPRPRATDNMSRQASTASNLSSPPLKISSPQYSPPTITTRFSPPANMENLPLGKRYIGPVIMEEEPDPMDEELLKSKMAEDYQQYKVSLRMEMIYQFHAEAADIEIKLVESLLADNGTKESRARAVQEHETSMMHLREQKEEERKRLCAEEREKRREEIRQHLAQRRFTQNREVDPAPKASPQVAWPDKTSVQQRSGKATHQKENIPLAQPPPPTPSIKLEVPSIIRKSSSTLSQDEASANEALFASAMAMIQGKPGAAGLTPAQASLNEAIFSGAVTMLAAQSQPESSGKSTLHPPSIMKKSNSSRSQEHDVPQITVSFAEPPTVAAEPAQVLPSTAKGKKGKKGQPVVQPPPTMPVTITEEPEIDAEPSPPTLSLWETASVVAKSAWGAASASVPTSKSKLSASVEEDGDAYTFSPAPAPSKGNANPKKAASATKKGKKVTITEEPDVDADPIVTPPPTSKTKATKGGWGSVNAKPSKATPPVIEKTEPEPAPPPPPVTPTWGKKTAQPSANAKSCLKPQLKVTISEELESEFEPSPAPARTSKAKSAWDVPAATPSASTSVKAGKKAKQQQAESRRGATTPGLKSVRVDTVPDSEDEMAADDTTMPGALGLAGSEEAEEGDTSTWFNPENMNYWANFMAGQSEAETQVVPETTEQTGMHVRWTPTINGESDDEEFDEADGELATNIWMQYAISGGDIPSMGDAHEEPQVMSSETQRDTSLWERGKGQKKLQHPPSGDFGNRAQQTSVFDRAAFTGQWPKMETWLSPPSRGQSSGSSRVF